MFSLSVFDKEFNIKGSIDNDELLDMALEISGFKHGGVETLSPITKQVMYIYERVVRKNFVELMLFVDATHALISKASGMDIAVIDAYAKLFFDNTQIIGQLGKTEYYEEIYSKHREGTIEFDRGLMFQEAHMAGPEVILAQFNIELADYDVAAYKDRVSKYVSWNHRRVSKGDMEMDEYTPMAKAADGIISTIDKALRKDEGAKKSDLQGLTDILTEMYDQGLTIGTVDVDFYDVTTGEVTEAAALPAPKEEIEVAHIEDNNEKAGE